MMTIMTHWRLTRQYLNFHKEVVMAQQQEQQDSQADLLHLALQEALVVVQDLERQRLQPQAQVLHQPQAGEQLQSQHQHR
jgi:hypothetical protein